MNVHLMIRNKSRFKHLYRKDVLTRLAQRICAGEGIRKDAEISVLFCDAPFIRGLNRTYRGKDAATDVLSFWQPGLGARRPVVLGDIVISLESVSKRWRGVRPAMRDEVRLLFCHGLLHLLGRHHSTARDRKRMATKQSEYLEVSPAHAWPDAPPAPAAAARKRSTRRGSPRNGGKRHIGR